MSDKSLFIETLLEIFPLARDKFKWYIQEIRIDNREKARGYSAKLYYQEMEYNAVIEALEYGDYCFKSNKNEIVFEYKNIFDLVKSINDHSLFNEVANQTIKYEYSYLIVEGDLDKELMNLFYKVPEYRTQYKTPRRFKFSTRKQVEGAYDRIYSMYVPIIFVNSEEEAFDKMLDIVRKIGDGKKYGKIIRPSRKNLSTNPSVHYLTGVKGISIKLANRICDSLDISTLEDLLKYDASDFQTVNGISKNKAEKIHNYLHNHEV